jgi:Tfp pilus assembly protein PilF
MWSDSQEAVDKYNEGISLLKKNDQDTAVMAFSQAINIDSNFLAPRFELGLISYKKGNYSEAARQFSIITERIHSMLSSVAAGQNKISNKNYALLQKFRCRSYLWICR